MLHNLRCIPKQSPHEDCSLWLQAPGHVPLSVHLEGVAGEGPGAGGGAELLAGGGGLAVEGAAARQEPGQAVALPGQLQAGGQLARGRGGGQEHLRRLQSGQPSSSIVATGRENGCIIYNCQNNGTNIQPG